MKVLIQRVTEASVQVDGVTVGRIGKGLCVFLGVHYADTEQDMDYIITRLLTTKLWPDRDSKSPWKESVLDIQGQILVVSQFTLYGVVGRNGRAPDFHKAMKAEQSKAMYEEFISKLSKACPERVDFIQSGTFQAYMDVSIRNDGPVTLELESSNFQKSLDPTKKQE
jgi:D-tyrosyl-tRNA(Tyr) deacylase